VTIRGKFMHVLFVNTNMNIKFELPSFTRSKIRRGPKILNESRDPDHENLGKFVIPTIILYVSYLCIKSEDSSFSHSKDMKN